MQWTYFGYLAAIKQQNGAAMSAGRLSTFWDIYFERDLREGTLTEAQAQEIVDDLVIKWRIVRFLRAPEYNELFSGDPVWVTEVLGGMGEDGRTLVTKSAFRMLQTLNNLGPAPEPNLTVFWSPRLPVGFKNFAIKASIDTSSIQYESDDLMRPKWGDDCAIACCVSAMRVGKQMQFFGARVNLPKTLLYALNGGRDELTGEQIGPMLAPITAEVLDYDEVMGRLDPMLDWLAKTYVNALNVIHYMHDKYCYEAVEMALHDRDVLRTMACGIAGLSHTADSLSAIKYAKVRPVRDERGLMVDFKVEGEFPCYGNNDDQADDIAKMLVSKMMSKIREYPTYRNAVHTQSVLTITSNVVYGKKTGNTPDGRKKGEAFAPGANPSNGRDSHGALAALMSVAKIPYDDAEDGISLTLSVVPTALGTEAERLARGCGALDAYFSSGGFHVNINVLNRETLADAMKHPEKYPQLTVRVSGLRGELRQADEGAAARRDEPHLPRLDVGACHEQVAGRQPLRAARRARRRGREQARSTITWRSIRATRRKPARRTSSATCTRTKSAPRWTGRASASSVSSRAARCAASSATTRTPGTSTTAIRSRSRARCARSASTPTCSR